MFNSVFTQLAILINLKLSKHEKPSPRYSIPIPQGTAAD